MEKISQVSDFSNCTNSAIIRQEWGDSVTEYIYKERTTWRQQPYNQQEEKFNSSREWKEIDKLEEDSHTIIERRQ